MYDRLRWWNDYELNICLCKKIYKCKFEKRQKEFFLFIMEICNLIEVGFIIFNYFWRGNSLL